MAAAELNGDVGPGADPLLSVNTEPEENGGIKLGSKHNHSHKKHRHTNTDGDDFSAKKKDKKEKKHKHKHKHVNGEDLDLKEEKEPKPKKDKKRKDRDVDGDAEDVQVTTDEPKKKKHKKHKPRSEDTSADDDLDEGQIDEAADNAERKQKRKDEKEKKDKHERKEKKKKLLPREIRAQRKQARRDKEAENARRNAAIREERNAIRAEREKARMEEHPEEMIASNVANMAIEPEPPKPPPHPESITAALERGEKLNLPDPPLPPKNSFFIDVPELRNVAVKPQANQKQALANFNPPPGMKVMNYKGAKYIREKAKREMKREWRKWQEARENPDKHRPDGSLIVTREEREARIAAQKAEKDAKRKAAAEKVAKRELKEQMKVERRVARKEIRSAKKRANHALQMQHISNKAKRIKREKDEAAAAEQGMTYEEYLKWKEEDLARKKEERRQRAAEKLGITVEEYKEKRSKEYDQKEMQKEANKLRITLEDYMNQDASPDTSDIPSDFEDKKIKGMKDGTYDQWGRSPIDRMWDKRLRRDQEERKAGKGDTTSGTSEKGTSVLGTAEKDDEEKPKPIGEMSESSESDGGVKLNMSDSDLDSDSDSDLDSDSVSSDEDDKVKVDKPSAKPQAKSVAETEDFIPLEPNSSFMIDSTGNPNQMPSGKVRVKDMTKEERKARLEKMRERREQKAAEMGAKKMSKKERRRVRAKRKEHLLGQMTHDILIRNKKEREVKEARAKDPDAVKPYFGGGGDGSITAGKKQANLYDEENKRDPILGGADYVKLAGQDGGATAVEKQYRKRPGGAPSKMEIKQARRDARRIMRGIKKGKIPEHEIPAGWDRRGVLKGKEKRKSMGNGGREPKRFYEGKFKA